MNRSPQEIAQTGAPPVVVVAPDSLKGSCSAPEAARAMASGARAALGPDARILELPMADGGEGTLEALMASRSGRIETVPTTDALGRSRNGRIGLSNAPTRLAIIETAEANGLPAVADAPLRPLDADTAGVGSLILAALDSGADEIILCVGGSATSDGGAGMLRVLGARLLDASGADIGPGARGLSDLHRIDLSGMDPRAAQVRWRIACDVDNPLTGPRGAGAVYGPQKGATSEDVLLIDANLDRLARVLAEATGAECEVLSQQPGLGAAGGLGCGPVAIFRAELVPGAELVAEAVGLRAALTGADLVLTAEGRLDSQSLSGKVVSRVLADAGDAAVMVIAGSLGLSAVETREAGISAAFSLARGPAPLEDLQRDTRVLLSEAAAQACGAFLAGREHGDCIRPTGSGIR